MHLRRIRSKPYAGGGIASSRDETFVVPSGRLVFRVHVGKTLTVGEYTEIVLWPAETPVTGDHLGERAWAAVHSRPEVIPARTDGTVRAVVAAGRYRFFACWGVLKSPLSDVEVGPGEEVRVDVRFDLGPQPDTDAEISGAWTKPEAATVESVATAIRSTADSISSVARVLGP